MLILKYNMLILQYNMAHYIIFSYNGYKADTFKISNLPGLRRAVRPPPRALKPVP